MKKASQIPKRLFFIWLGNQVPSYASASMQAFQQVNPDFEIALLHYTDAQLEKIWHGEVQDPPLRRALQRVLMMADDYVRWQAEFYGSSLHFLQLLSDVARIEVLNEHGGIYLDCDTFPISKFDDNLLSNDFFVVQRKSRGMQVFLDNFFLGKSLTSPRIESPYAVDNPYLVDDTIPFLNTPKHCLLKRKFFECSLEVGEHVLPASSYVDHYFHGSWTAKPVETRERWYSRLWRR